MAKRNSMARREPNGRIQREQILAPAEVRRLRDAALSGMRDPTWGTEIGRLYLAGKITEVSFAAGKRWGELATLYSQALCSPCPDPKAVCLDRMGGESIDPDSHEGRREARRHVRAVTSFIDAHAALKSTSALAERAVRHVCERDQILIGHDNLLALIHGLIALAGFWGLTNHRRAMSDRHS